MDRLHRLGEARLLLLLQLREKVAQPLRPEGEGGKDLLLLLLLPA